MLGVVVDDRAVGEGLLDVAVREVHDHVVVREDLALGAVREDDLLHPVVVEVLDLAVRQGGRFDQLAVA